MVDSNLDYYILNSIYRVSDYTAIALLLFTALPLLCVAVAAFFYVRNNERKRHSREKTFIDRSKVKSFRLGHDLITKHI